ncbi:MAG: hypothetical protein ACPG7U_01350 [Holosporaceae bacterium]
MLKNRLHTAVILATAAVAPLSLEAIRLPACLGGQSEKTVPHPAATQLNGEETSKPASRKSNPFNRIFGKKKKEAPKHGFEGLLAQQATIIKSADNQADAKTATISMTSTIQTQPAAAQKKTVRFATESNTSVSPAPAPVDVETKTSSTTTRPMTALFADPLNLLASVSVDIEPVKNHETPPQTTETSVDSIRFSTILEDLKPFLTSPQQPSQEGISEEPEAQSDLKTQLKKELEQELLKRAQRQNTSG